MTEQVPSMPVCLHDGDKTASLIIRYGDWLPLELNPIYRDAVQELRGGGRNVVQFTDLHGNGGSTMLRRLLSKALNMAVNIDATDIVAVVSPHSARGYRAMHFTDMLPDDPPRVWDCARDEDGDLLPTRLIRLAIDALPAAVLRDWLAVQNK